MKTIYKLFFLFFTTLSIISCKKFLDKTPDKKLAIPKTVKDLQGLLDNNTLTQNGPGVNDLGIDDYYLLPSELQSKSPAIRNCYTWEKDIFQGGSPSDWSTPYQQIYICNVVLEELKNISQTSINQVEWNFAKGHALFCRAFYFYLLSETFGNPYKPSTASTDLGIPLRLSSSLEEKIGRATVQQTFDQIISDLETSKDLLPDQIDFAHRNRPSKAAVYAMMARVYLTTQNYDKANLYANSCLQLHNTIVDYNTYPFPFGSPNRPFPLPPNDFTEIIYQNVQINYGLISSNTTSVDSVLYNLYDNHDLRKTLFFGSITGSSTRKYFKGQYSGLTSSFCGLATDEIYLIRAEAFARKGDTSLAMQDLNALYKKRWDKNFPYITISSTDVNDAVKKILQERRKELLFRGLRWSDLRRLNQNPQTEVTITRNLNGQFYTLVPNSPRYVYPIPDIEIQLSGISQNPR